MWNVKYQITSISSFPYCKFQVARSKSHVPDCDVSVSIVDLRMVNPTRNVPSSALQVDVDFTRGQWYAIDDFHVPFPWLPWWLTVHNNLGSQTRLLCQLQPTGNFLCGATIMKCLFIVERYPYSDCGAEHCPPNVIMEIVVQTLDVSG
jgi:hypothetical protein